MCLKMFITALFIKVENQDILDALPQNKVWGPHLIKYYLLL